MSAPLVTAPTAMAPPPRLPSTSAGRRPPRHTTGRRSSRLQGSQSDRGRCDDATASPPACGEVWTRGEADSKQHVAALGAHGSRRALLAAAAAASLLPAQSAAAAARFEGFLPLPPPDPVKVPRKSLDQKFAVLMMRSAYETADALDFIPMDEFQVKFWKLRQAEYSPYTLQYSPIIIRQGQLTDPLYFDFISYAQYALLAKEMPRGRQVFEEFCEIEEDCPGDRKRVVRRDQTLSDNKLLPAAMEAGIGDKMYAGLVKGFEGETWGGPPPLNKSASFEEVVAGVRRIVDIFVEKGYAIKGEVGEVVPRKAGNGGSFVVRFQGPCNLWGIQRLGSIRAPLVNAMDAMTVAAFLRASGRSATYTLEATDAGVEAQWEVPSSV